MFTFKVESFISKLNNKSIKIGKINFDKSYLKRL